MKGMEMGRASVSRLLFPTLVGVSLLLAAPVGAGVVEWSGNGHGYEYIGLDMSWSDAESRAELWSYKGVPGHLVTVTSAAENKWLTDTFPLVGQYWTWMGGLQAAGSAEPAGGWSWVTGEPWVYSNWLGNEPNNNGDEDRLMCWADLSADGYTWNDLAGSSREYSIVEYDVPSPAVPEPGLCVLGLGAVVVGACARRKGRKKEA